ncbi:hypothetical protein E2C01_094550 [Portunus trituberculatus]|uniref:Uncharacterized protein n=1 Tax=Portunus trituberculatus TaxID=210409 RepID=A0A5B7K3G6_PORTR|nr:hypothetical protein [Portunus trituberculatus]
MYLPKSPLNGDLLLSQASSPLTFLSGLNQTDTNGSVWIEPDLHKIFHRSVSIAGERPDAKFVNETL